MAKSEIPRRLLTVKEFAELCRVHRMTVHRWIATGKIKTVQVGGFRGVRRILESEAERVLNGAA